MLRRGIDAGFWIVLSSVIGLFLGAGGLEEREMSLYLACVPTYFLLLPTACLVIARAKLPTSTQRLGFWLSSAGIALIGLFAIQIATPLYEWYGQSYDVSQCLTIIATLVVGLIYGIAQWFWFMPRTQHDLTWLVGAVLGWFFPAIPLLMFPPGYQG